MTDLDPEFERVDEGWQLRIDRPAAHRLEYQLTVRTEDSAETAPDPANPFSVPGPFGVKSEIRFPDYREPLWLGAPATGSVIAVDTDSGALEFPVPVFLWSPDDLEPAVPAALLVAHDGYDMADRGSLLALAGELHREHGPLRVALLDPPKGYRDDWYSANPEYADHLASAVLPAIAEKVAVGPVIGMGASLGALSMAHLHRRHPGTFDGLVLQSGSFFTPELDPQESSYRHFDRIAAAVAEISTGPAERTIPILLTCGSAEENVFNNRALASALDAQGYLVDLQIVPDAHNMIGWRDAWIPGLDALVALVSKRP